MAPSPSTEDYYMILGVQPNASPGEITKAYRRLALEFHPDRPAEGGSPYNFQLISQAYVTLTDEGKRQAYDLIYHSIPKGNIRAQSTQQAQRTSPLLASAPRSETHDEIAQIAALRKAKRDRNARWNIKQNALQPTILELQRTIWRLEHEISYLANFEAAESAVEARKNSWTTWILSPFYKERGESEEEKPHRDRVRQERKIEKDLKERQLSVLNSELLEKEDETREAKKRYDAKNLGDDQSILIIEAQKRRREELDQLRKECKEAERRQKEWADQAKIRREQQAEFYREQEEAEAKIWRQRHEQRNKRAQEAREQSSKAQAEVQAAQATRRKEHERRYRHPSLLSSYVSSSQTRQVHSSGCSHNAWWDEVEERTACPKCHDLWTYLLRCPRCQTKACPRCLDVLRPNYTHHLERTSRRETRKPRSPSPNRYDYGLSGRYDLYSTCVTEG